MALVEVTEQEKIVLEAAREYGDALAVLRGKPPFSGCGMRPRLKRRKPDC